MPKPWLNNKDWTNASIRSTAKSDIWGGWILSIIWNGMCLLGLYIFHAKINFEDPGILIIFVFPLVGIFFIYMAVKTTLEWIKIGPTTLTLDPFPGSLGGDFGGTIKIKLPNLSGCHFKVCLQCLAVSAGRSSRDVHRNSHHVEKVKWERTGYAEVKGQLNSTELRFKFKVPDNLPQSQEPSDHYTCWSLNLEAKIPGSNFDRTFIVPVYKTQELLFSDATKKYISEGIYTHEFPKNIVQISQQGNEVKLYYPWHRNRDISSLMLIYGSIFLTVGCYVVFGPSEQIAGAIFAIIGLVVTITGLCFLVNTLTVFVSPKRIRVNRRIFGFGFSREIDKEALRDIRKADDFQPQASGKIGVRYKLVAYSKNNPEITVGDGIGNDQIADRLTVFIKKACNL